MCGGYDNDCNGRRDDPFARQSSYRDGDRDGYGGREIEACVEPIDDPDYYWVDVGGDFDDDDPTEW